MYELIRREMIDGRRETCAQGIMLQERGAPRGLQRQGRTGLGGEMFKNGEMFNGEMVIWSEIGGEWPLQKLRSSPTSLNIL
jgi:hypothetical protein